MGDLILLSNFSRPLRLIELSNATQMASRTLAENSRLFAIRSPLSPPCNGGTVQGAVRCRFEFAVIVPQDRCGMVYTGRIKLASLFRVLPTARLTFQAFISLAAYGLSRSNGICAGSATANQLS